MSEIEEGTEEGERLKKALKKEKKVEDGSRIVVLRLGEIKGVVW